MRKGMFGRFTLGRIGWWSLFLGSVAGSMYMGYRIGRGRAIKEMVDEIEFEDDRYYKTEPLRADGRYSPH